MENGSPRSPETLLPLRPVELQILVSLGSGPRHGYGILQDADERGEGDAVPGLATLYRALRRLDDEGLIQSCEAPQHADEEADLERRRYFRLTPLGREVLEAEIARLRRLVEEFGVAEGSSRA